MSISNAVDVGFRKVGNAVNGIKHRAVAIKSLVGLMEDKAHAYENHGDTREKDIRRVVDRLAFEIAENLVDNIVTGVSCSKEQTQILMHELHHAEVEAERRTEELREALGKE
jgi:hypothetical protein